MIHLHKEREMASCSSRREVTQAGLFPVAYTIGTDFRAASRAHSEKTIHWNGW